MCFIFSSKWPQVSNYARYATILCSPKIQEMKLIAPCIHQNKLTHTPKNVVYYKYPITLSKRGKFTRTLILWFNLNSPPTDLSIGVRWPEIPFPRPIFPLFVCYNVYRLEKKSSITSWCENKSLFANTIIDYNDTRQVTSLSSSP